MAIIISCFIMISIEEIVKCYTYARNATHRSVKKAKRAMIVALIISLGFAFANTVSIITLFFHMHVNLGWFGISRFILVVTALGIPLHVLCGYLSGLLYTKSANNI